MSGLRKSYIDIKTIELVENQTVSEKNGRFQG